MTTAEVSTGGTGGIDAATTPMRGSLSARLAEGTDACALSFAGQGWAWWEDLVPLLDQRDDLLVEAETWARFVDDLLATPRFRDQGLIPVVFDPIGWSRQTRPLPDAGLLTSPALSFVGCLYTQLLDVPGPVARRIRAGGHRRCHPGRGRPLRGSPGRRRDLRATRRRHRTTGASPSTCIWP